MPRHSRRTPFLLWGCRCDRSRQIAATSIAHYCNRDTILSAVTPTNKLPASDLRLLGAFEACQLSPADFGHREHLRLAYIYLTLYPFDLALEKLRTGLQRLLAHLGAPASVYHETMTRAWLLAVRHFMTARAPTTGSEDFLSASAALLDKNIMFSHYDRKTLLSPSARETFVEPDLEPIPRHV